MITRRRALIAGAAAVAVSLVFLLGGVLATSPSAGSAAPAAAPAAPDRSLAGFGAGGDGTVALVTRLERAVGRDPGDVKSLATLGLAYEQRWRETGDSSYLPLAGRALQRARRISPRDPLTIQGLGSLALTKHEFRQALRLGRLAVRLAPYSANPLGIEGDALLELGRYQQAFAAFQRMVDLEPNLSSYARVSYARELTGDLQGAIAVMRLALDAAAGDREGYAWTSVQLGKLYWLHGDGTTAESLYRNALAVFPGYVYALDALAPIEAARGHIRRAIAFEQRAVDAIPLPQFVGQLGDLYARAGRPRLARQQEATVAVIQRLLAANGVKVDLEAALYRADHGIRPESTVVLARKARALRPSIVGDDALSWALARAGRCTEARTWSSRALRLGTKDPLLFFHRGYIERCLGDAAGSRVWLGRALALNPHFSVLWSPAAMRWAGR
jgi:tetratricopeptide (TPR) repeat protein